MRGSFLPYCKPTPRNSSAANCKVEALPGIAGVLPGFVGVLPGMAGVLPRIAEALTRFAGPPCLGLLGSSQDCWFLPGFAGVRPVLP